jgi:23S rRNA (pseudouridine1915-N3)-methyltransferase
VEDYLERIRHFLPIEQLELPVGTGESGNGQGKGAIAREAAAIESRLGSGGRTVALDPAGKLMTTEDFARWLQGAMSASVPRVNFVIGGAWGLGASITEKADLKLSLSPMTFPHEMARLVLAEQIYRALSIWKGLPYHK